MCSSTRNDLSGKKTCVICLCNLATDKIENRNDHKYLCNNTSDSLFLLKHTCFVVVFVLQNVHATICTTSARTLWWVEWYHRWTTRTARKSWRAVRTDVKCWGLRCRIVTGFDWARGRYASKDGQERELVYSITSHFWTVFIRTTPIAIPSITRISNGYPRTCATTTQTRKRPFR